MTTSKTTTLIPNPDPTKRILLHITQHTVDGPVSKRVTVETAETDTIGAHQWGLTDNSEHSYLSTEAVLALIEYARPGATTRPVPTVIGLSDNGTMRLTVSPSNGHARLVVEQIEADQAGAPRWARVSYQELVPSSPAHTVKVSASDDLIAVIEPR